MVGYIAWWAILHGGLYCMVGYIAWWAIILLHGGLYCMVGYKKGKEKTFLTLILYSSKFPWS